MRTSQIPSVRYENIFFMVGKINRVFHSLMAPRVRPLTRYFDTKVARTTTGMMPMSDMELPSRIRVPLW